MSPILIATASMISLGREYCGDLPIKAGCIHQIGGGPNAHDGQYVFHTAGKDPELE